MGNRLDNRAPKFTTKRGNTYYINFRLPDGTFFRRSLGTDSLKAVQVTMSRLSPYIPLVQNGSLSVAQFKMHIDGFREATQRDFDTYLLDWLRMGVEEAKRMPELGRTQRQIDSQSTISPAASVTEAKGRAEIHLNRVYSGDDSSARMLLATLHQKKVSFGQRDLEQAYEVAGQIDMHQAMLHQAYEAFYSGDIVRYRTLVESMQSQLTETEIRKKPATKQTVAIVETSENDTTPLLSDAWRLFVAEKGKTWAITIARENNRFYEVLMHVLGDVPVGSITKQSIRQTLAVIENLPRRNLKPYSEMSLSECIDFDVPEDDLISSANVKKHLKIYSSFFKVFLKDEKDILENSPTEGIRYEVVENKGGHYSRHEMQRLIERLSTFTDWRRDYFLTLIYTGARRGELAAIRKEHIRKDEETGRFYIFIEGGKTEHAQRQIPLSKQIEGLLLARIKPLKSDGLVFGDLPTYEHIAFLWRSLMEECNIPKYNEFGQKRVIHACRHTFISEAIAKTGNAALVQFVVGHSRTQSLGITARYTHRPPLSDLLQVVDCIDY
ncbi:tyrosine-type recombinase/integrase [Klebsiella michiganensis]|nr:MULTISPECIES: tyrosine-type recombinase/integrase [Klebsiella]MCZ0062859.1 tyrosine-type recombinase/integrase [Klebsiella michiganensis]MCZ0078858.1 tyrosine-type recombinase/integrase [Klebsiella michiganensis]MEB2850456.1 tyrosine-type recombinase/integrase [Klebsiella oxytoca]MEB2876895.1 tyrosine-type recombinase/integrase [Klebsiella oxytoca]WAT37924.1 tyrosine-type recombinase/integrase [Klebsiella michiganensis]